MKKIGLFFKKLFNAMHQLSVSFSKENGVGVDYAESSKA